MKDEKRFVLSIIFTQMFINEKLQPKYTILDELKIFKFICLNFI